MGKVAYIIPGFTESNKQIAYKQIASYFKSKGIKPIPVNVSWKYKTLSDYIEQFFRIYEKNDGNEVYLLGFSYGAMISFVASTKIKPKMQILCSLSPWFKEYLPYMKRYYKMQGKRRLEDHKNYSFEELSKNVTSKTIILVGDSEIKECMGIAKDVNKKIKNSKLIMIKNGKHIIAQKEYQDALEDIISKLD